MAGKKQTGGVNKSELVRAVLASEPGIRPSMVVNRLKEQGHEVSSSLVNNVMCQLKAKANKVASNGTHAAPATTPVVLVEAPPGPQEEWDALTQGRRVMATIKDVRRLLAEVGDKATLKELIDAIG